MKATMPKGYQSQYSETELTAEHLANTQGFVLIEFGENWCGHCQRAQAAIEQCFPAELPHLKVIDGKGKALGRAFKVKLWPTLILLKDGAEIKRVVRPTSADDLAELFES